VLNKLFVYIIFSLLVFPALGQNKPKGDFAEKVTKIGQPVKYSLSFHHPKNMELFFPDSSYSFTPFEFISKKYFPTKTHDSTSLDSVVYTLRTFEIKEELELSLPVFVIEQGDTLRIYSTHDKITIKQFLTTIPDTLVFMSDAKYKTVMKRFNYPYFFAFATLFIISLILFYFIFGKAVLRNYRLYKMHRNHIQFLQNFDKLMKEMVVTPNLSAIEKVLGEWKNYLTKLEQKPINTFTTKEIISLFNKEDLKEKLQEVDRSIYSGSITGNPAKALEVLKKFSNKRYKKRRKELRNAR
jgi:hypothetical protein